MSDKVKEIVLKSVLVVASFCLIMMPISTVLAIWIEDYTDFFAIAFLVVGGIFILLLFTLDYKIKPVPAEKFSLNFKSYNAFMDFMEKKLENQGYKKNNKNIIDENTTLSLYIRHPIYRETNCVVIIKTTELTNKLVDILDENIHKSIVEYYGTEYISDTINMIPIVCVDRVTTAFNDYVNSSIAQGYKKILLPVGISFGGKKIYIARQVEGVLIKRYKLLRKYFLEMLNVDEQNKEECDKKKF